MAGACDGRASTGKVRLEGRAVLGSLRGLGWGMGNGVLCWNRLHGEIARDARLRLGGVGLVSCEGADRGT